MKILQKTVLITLLYFFCLHRSVGAEEVLINSSGITPQQLLLAIYNDYQLTSLPTEKSALPSSLEFQKDFNKNVQLASNQGYVKTIGKIPVNIDFRTWPYLASHAFDQAVIPPRKKLAELVQFSKNNLHSKNLSDNEIIEATWKNYFKQDKTVHPEGTTLIALSLLEKKIRSSNFFAIDLGAGDGRDTIAMLEKGLQVLAIEPYEEPLILLRQKAKHLGFSSQLTVQQKSFEKMNLELPKKAQLINASYSLPYASKKEFNKIWNNIENALEIDGLFSGQFFGKNDSFARESDVTTHSQEELKELFSHFKILHWEEQKYEGLMMNKKPKHWHIYHIVAQKQSNRIEK